MHLLAATALLTLTSFHSPNALANALCTDGVAKVPKVPTVDSSVPAGYPALHRRSPQPGLRKRSAPQGTPPGPGSSDVPSSHPHGPGHQVSGLTTPSKDVPNKTNVARLLHHDPDMPTYQVSLPERRAGGRKLTEGSRRKGYEDLDTLDFNAPDPEVRDTMEHHLKHQAMNNPHAANSALSAYLKRQGSLGEGKPGEGATGRLAQDLAFRKAFHQYGPQGPSAEEAMNKLLANEKKQEDEAKAKARAAEQAAEKKRAKKQRSKERKQQQRQSQSMTEATRHAPDRGREQQQRQSHSLNDLTQGTRTPTFSAGERSLAASVETEASRLGQSHLSSPRK